MAKKSANGGTGSESAALAQRPRIPCPPIILEKVRQFTEHADVYKSGNYSEAQLRIDFINPMLEALGWDVNNTNGYAEAYREVVYEDALKIGGTSKAPDYGFYIGGRASGGGRKFYLEAKRPSVPILFDTKPAFQLRRYARSAELPLSILTNFKDFIVYDTRYKPSPRDKATAASIFTIKYAEYPERWDEIASVFSREAILRGAFDKFAQGKRKRGMEPLGEDFLKTIEEWRDLLARDIAANNPDITVENLNFAVQRTIDRILFLRICEDRGIEPIGNLMRLLNGDKIYARLGDIFRGADDRYNSGIFHFPLAGGRKPDPSRIEPPDDLTLGLTVSDDAIQTIIRKLYDTPTLYTDYEFSVIPPEILGQVYERFLGKVIALDARHRVKIEEKPEVRKAGGVYYTPTYIVDYIVKNTVGKLLENKSPKDAAKLTILDPASGSGSFLIGAYQFLLDWHLRWYLDHKPDEHCKGKNPPLMRTNAPSFGDEADTPRASRTGGLDYRLTTQKRKEILLNSIYGVDIDAQAVEVTKLSLLLKVLEGESQESVSAQLKFLHQRALPDLGRNIKCGNSLIGEDFDDSALDGEERRKINKFNWQREFPHIFKNGGFDAVIGNPPYVNAWELFAAMPAVRQYINDASHFRTADRHWDLYVVFLERALSVLRRNGRLAFIIPFSYAIQKYGTRSRKMILDECTIESIADLRTVRVFGTVPVITIVPTVRKAQCAHAHTIRIDKPGPGSTKYACDGIVPSHDVLQRDLLLQHEVMWRLDLSRQVSCLVEKIKACSFLLDDACYINYGAQMSSKTKGKFGKDHVIRASRTSAYCKPMVSGRDLHRYSLTWAGKYVDWSFADQMYGPRWPRFFESPKLMIRDITGTHRIEATLDESGMYCDHTILCAVRKCDIAGDREFAKDELAMSSRINPRYLCGIVASRLLSAYCYFVLTGEGVRIGGGFHTYPHTIRQFPIRAIDFKNKADKAAHDRMVKLVERMLELNKKLAAAKSPIDKERLPREIEATDRQIDQLVYQLYGLTDDEIRIVEAATAKPEPT